MVTKAGFTIHVTTGFYQEFSNDYDIFFISVIKEEQRQCRWLFFGRKKHEFYTGNY